jgi:hypothetical protein
VKTGFGIVCANIGALWKEEWWVGSLGVGMGFSLWTGEFEQETRESKDSLLSGKKQVYIPSCCTLFMKSC